ncbi:MAG: hypothetical protein OSA40_07090 [Phycisphaerales bacterium]|nr:hypothetical protein [Phycisphaerales bacterium]
MAIQTSVKRSFILWNVLYIVLCGGLGAWGAYDYWVTIPDQEAAVVEYEELSARRGNLEIRGVLWTLMKKKSDGTITESEDESLATMRTEFEKAGVQQPPPPLSEAEVAEYEAIKVTLKDDFENTAPEPPASYDGWVNFWIYFVGTGILGTPWFVWKLLSRRGQAWRLEDDGSFSTPDGVFAAEEIADIDMSIWMKKSIAKVIIKDRAEPITLDDYEYANVYRIVGALASKFHPDEWTEEAKPIKEGGTDEDDLPELVIETDHNDPAPPEESTEHRD